MDQAELRITDSPPASRYEAAIGGTLVGVVEYRRLGGRLVLVHTEVMAEFGGRGIGAALARHILDEARAAGTRVTVKCPFIRAWLERHPDYQAITTPDAGPGGQG